MESMQLSYDQGVEYTVNLVDAQGEIAATGSLQQNVIKCVAVDDRHQGEGLSSRVVTLLMNHAIEQGNSHLFVFTKPKNIAMFSDLGFFPIIQTEDVLFMENVRDGIGRYVRSLQHPKDNGGVIGAAVMNCNPFTNGHRYLVETAASQCELLHLFVLSEDRSAFPAQVRYELVKQGVSDIGNVVLHHTSDYLISSAVFADLFYQGENPEQSRQTASLICASSANTLLKSWASPAALWGPSRLPGDRRLQLCHEAGAGRIWH